MSTKPYVSGGAYLNRMSDYCGGCRFQPRKRTGDPGDFEGAFNLVFVAFRMRQQRDVDHWLRELGDVETAHEGLAVYEVPLLARYPRFYRRWIDDGMRSGISDPTTRSRTVTVYTNRSGSAR